MSMRYLCENCNAHFLETNLIEFIAHGIRLKATQYKPLVLTIIMG
jgi:hypothetical protein